MSDGYKLSAVAPRFARCGGRESWKHKSPGPLVCGLCFRLLDYHYVGLKADARPLCALELPGSPCFRASVSKVSPLLPFSSSAVRF